MSAPTSEAEIEDSIDLRDRPRSVAVVGLGYVGLPTALAFTEAGIDVLGIDVSRERLEAIRSRRVDLVPDDARRLARLEGGDELCLTTQTSAAAIADAVVICVPTPVQDDREPDLGPVSAACANVVEHARPGQVIVLTSTTYVGCTRELLVEPLERRGLRAGRDVMVAFAPERIDPANTAYSQREVPRVVGGATSSCVTRAAELIGTISPVHPVTSLEAAELTKLYENTFRAVNIALANELADIARELELDASEIVDAAATKPFGFMPFRPGPGVGGHCIPCDPHYLLWQLRERGTDAPLVSHAMDAIDARPRRVVRRASDLLMANGVALEDARILAVGVTYKPGVQDLRESPAVKVIGDLVEGGARVDVHDPMIDEVRCNGSTPLRPITNPDAASYDLVLAMTLHPGHDYRWLRRARRVLDATYRLRDVPASIPL